MKMNKREFLKTSGKLALGAFFASTIVACSSENTNNEGNEEPNSDATNENTAPTTFELPELGYEYNALAPSIDAETVEIHYSKHHAGYVRKLNAALEGNAKFGGMDLETILANVGADDTAVRNNGGGHYNHSLYWSVLGTSKGAENAPSGDLANAINSKFTSFDGFKEAFTNAAKTRFGSGWAWLCVNDAKELFVSSTPNQDNPLMKGLVKELGTPILGIDVWEHAYYLFYQNERGRYINSFYDIIQWDKVAERFAAAMK